MRRVERKRLNWNALAEEFYGMVEDTTPETAAVVEVTTDSDGLACGFDVKPAESNTSGTCYCLMEIVDFCRCKGLSCCVGAFDGKAEAMVF